jgi:hypothetical protein
MPEQFLTVAAFDRWAQRLEGKLDRVIEKDGEAAIAVEARLVFLETYQKQTQSRIAWVSGIMASVVAATITSIITWIKFGR